MARRRFALPGDTFWAWQAIDGGFAATVETNESDAAFQDLLRGKGEAEELSLSDKSRGVFRMARIKTNRLDMVLFLCEAARGAALEPRAKAFRGR